MFTSDAFGRLCRARDALREVPDGVASLGLAIGE